MKLEIKKEFSTTQNFFFHAIYIDGEFKTTEISKEDALKRAEALKNNILHPFEPELVHSEEF